MPSIRAYVDQEALPHLLTDQEARGELEDDWRAAVGDVLGESLEGIEVIWIPFTAHANAFALSLDVMFSIGSHGVKVWGRDTGNDLKQMLLIFLRDSDHLPAGEYGVWIIPLLDANFGSVEHE